MEQFHLLVNEYGGNDQQAGYHKLEYHQALAYQEADDRGSLLAFKELAAPNCVMYKAGKSPIIIPTKKHHAGDDQHVDGFELIPRQIRLCR